jgi:hypothetical protein
VADKVTTTSTLLTRDELKQFLPSQRAIRAFESSQSVGTELATTVNQVIDDVSAVQAEVNDLELNTVRADALGGTLSIANLKQFSLAQQVHTSGCTVLWLTASASGGRCNSEYGIPNTLSYSRTTTTITLNGVPTQVRLVELDCAPFPDCDARRQVKVAAPGYPNLIALCEVIDATTNGDGTTHIRCYELYGDFQRPDIPLGSIPGIGGDWVFHDMQSSAVTHAQIAKANGWLGGVLDVINLGVGGSNTLDWQDPELRRYVESLPKSDIGVFDFGIGNDLTFPDYTTVQIAQRFDDCLTWAEGLVRQVIVLDPPGARLGGDATPLPNPQLTTTFTGAQLWANYLKAWIATRHKTVTFTDSETAFMRTSSFGIVDNDDMVRGQPVAEIVESKGVHLAPTGNDEIAADLLKVLRPLVSRWNKTSNVRPDFVYSNSVPDVGGLFNPNFLYPWFGAAPTVAVTFSTFIVGTGIEGTTVSGNGFVSGMTGVISVLPDWKRGGLMMRMNFNDPRPSTDINPNANLRLFYRGTTAYPILQALNDARLQTGYFDFFGRVAVFGFNQDSVFEINASLVAVTRSAWRAASRT